MAKKEPAHEELLAIASATAQRYGFSAGLRKARGDLLRARRKYGMDELRVLKTRKEGIFNTANSIEEAKKQLAEINTRMTSILSKMREGTREEQEKVKRFYSVVKYYDAKVVEALKRANMYVEYDEIPGEIENTAVEWNKERKANKARKK